MLSRMLIKNELLTTPGGKVIVPDAPVKSVPETAVLYIEPLPPALGPPDWQAVPHVAQFTVEVPPNPPLLVT